MAGGAERPQRRIEGEGMEKQSNIQPILPMQIAKFGYILLSITLCVLGTLRITMPGYPVETFSMLCGVVFVAFGLVRLVGFYAKDLYRLAFQYDFEFGILIMVLGALIFLKPGSFASMTCVLLGLLVLADALFKVRTMLEAKRFGIKKWWLLLMLAIITSILGGILVFYFGKQLNLLLGITLIAEGLLSLSTALTLVKIIRHQIKD